MDNIIIDEEEVGDRVKYNAVVYNGRAVAFTILEYKTRRNIELFKGKPHVFDHILDSAEINYYNKLRGIGVELLYTQKTKPKDRVKAKDIREKAEDKIEVPDIPEEVEEQFHELEVPEVDPIVTEEVEEEETLAEELEVVELEVEEGLEADLAEYLDMTYDEKSIYELAAELEVPGIRSNFKKSTVIDKIIENAYDSVYKLALS